MSEPLDMAASHRTRLTTPPGPATDEQHPIRVLLADDHTVFRQGLRLLLDQEDDLAVVGEAATGEEAQALVRELRPDVVLMDVNMPDTDGITATRAIRAAHAQTSVIMLTMYDEEASAVEAVRAGAQGYLVKTADIGEVTRAVRVTRQGTAVIDPALLPRLLRAFHRLASDPAAPPLARLSERELALVRLLVEGQSNKEMARALGLAESTVKNQLSQVFRKLGVQDRTQAAVYAIAHDLVPAG
jgi:DNA-binding NarL/FixJ family response regulator